MKSGFVSILGKPNAGKSTLLNRLTGTKLAGVSKKAQTTRQIIKGILTEDRGQMVFLDTPGFHKPKDPLGIFMLREVGKTFADADLILFMTGPEAPDSEDLALVQHLKDEQAKAKRPVFCVINKIDMMMKDAVLPVIQAYQALFAFAEYIPISALTGEQVALLLDKTFEHLPEHEPFFPPDILSDQTERFLAEEIIREKIFRLTGDEIPYSCAVKIDSFKEERRIVRISANVFVERESQKAILIGSGGRKMKQIGTEARQDLERMLEKKVFLQLWVKTLRNWKKDGQKMRELGYG